MTENKSRLVQSCYVEKTLDDWSLEENQRLDVESLFKVLEVLIDEGFGNYDIRFGYDSNCAFTSAMNDFDINNGTIYFKE